MTTAKNQQHHEAELFTRILTRMARLTESVEGLNEEMDELRKVLDGMGGNGVDGGWSVSRKFVYSIHPGACLNREPGGCDGDPVWSVVKHLEGPRISGSESTSWKMAWVYAAEILKAEQASKPVAEAKRPTSEWSTTPPTSDGFYWIATPDSDSYVIRFDARRKEFHFCGNGIDYEPSDFPGASYSLLLAPPGILKP